MYSKYIRDIISIIINKSNQNTLKGYLIRGSAGSFVVKIFNMIMIFVYSFVMVRILGATEYGIYEYVIAWVNLLTIPVVFGLDKLTIRVVSAAITNQDWGQIRGLLRSSIYIVALVTTTIFMCLLAITTSNVDGKIPYSLVVLWIGCMVLPITALNMIWEGFLRGLQHVLSGQIAIMVVRPTIVLLIFIPLALFTAIQLNALVALIVYNIASLVSLLLSMYLLLQYLPSEVIKTKPTYKWRAWIISAVPLMLMGGMVIINGRLGTIFLGLNNSPESAGIFALIFRITNLITFTQIAVGVVLSPTFASLYASRDMEKLQKVATRSVRAVFLISFPIVIMLFIFAPFFLNVFGSEFVLGTSAIRIMMVGDLINMMMGNVGVILSMTGYERDSLKGFVIGILVNVTCCIIFIPIFNVTGASIALTIANITWNLILAYYVYKRLGVYTSVFGNFSFLGGRKRKHT